MNIYSKLLYKCFANLKNENKNGILSETLPTIERIFFVAVFLEFPATVLTGKLVYEQFLPF
jgi:hypothetical protein